MAGSYDPAFHQSGSSTPMAPSPASNNSGQYKANINRQKTRKWVEAKKIDYGGDDWGADYDDNEPAEEPQQLPQPSKPMGPRSAATFPTISNAGQPHPALTGPRPLQTSGLRGSRGASPAVSPSPGARTPLGGPPLHIQTQQPNSPANQQTPTDSGSPWTSDPHSRRGTPVIEIPVLDRGFGGPRILPASQNPGPAAPPRFPHRKSSLSQADAPDAEFATPLGGPTPFGEGPQLGNATRPSMGSRPESSQTSVATVTAPNKPWVDSSGRTRSSSPGSASAKSPVGQGKALPFVRPADIYKNLAEEKEKVRRSMDSGRPSMDSLGQRSDSIVGSPTRTQSIPAQPPAQAQPQEQRTSLGDPQNEGDGTRSTGTRNARGDETSSTRPRPSLATVTERKSEYGIEGLIASYERRGGTPTTPTFDPYILAATGSLAPAPAPASPEFAPAVPEKDIKVRAAQKGPEEGYGRGFTGSAHYPENEGDKDKKPKEGQERPEHELRRLQEELRRLSTSPKLPELGRLSGFGFDLFSSSSSGPVNPTSSTSNPLSSSAPLSTVVESRSPPVSESPHNGGVVKVGKGQTAGEPGSSLVSHSAINTSAGDTPADAPAHPVDAHPNTDHSADSDRNPDRDTNSGSPGQSTAQPSQGPEAHQENLPVLRPQSGQPSKSEHQSGGEATSGSAEPMVPSETSLVTSGPQASQFVISSPIAFSAGSADGSGPPAYFDDPSGKLAVPQALQQAKDSYSTLKQVSAGEGETAAREDQASPLQSPPTQAPAQAPGHELTPGDDQSPPEVKKADGYVSEYHHYISATTPSDRTSQPSSKDDKPTQPTTPPKENIPEETFLGDVSQDTTMPPTQPVTAPPLPPAEQSTRPSFVTARMVSSPLSDDGSSASVKDTDKLSEEILRSFDSAGPVDSVDKTADPSNAANRMSVNPSAARESSFLPDLYDDYWSFAGTGGAEEEKLPALPQDTPSVPDALKVKAEEPRPESLVVAKDEPVRIDPASLDVGVDGHALEDNAQPGPSNAEVHRPNLSTKFSWEQGTPPVEPKSLVGQQQHAPPPAVVFTDGAHELPSEPVQPDADSSLATMHPEHPTAAVDENAARRKADDYDPDSEIMNRKRMSAMNLDKMVVGHEKVEGTVPEYSTAVDNQKMAMETRRASLGSRSPSSVNSIGKGPSSSPGSQPPVATSGSWVPGGPSYASTASKQATTFDGSQFNGPLNSHPVLTFREIMDNPSQAERIDQFNHARHHYATTGTGLDAILEHLSPLHPDIVVQAGRGLGAASQPYAQQLTRTTTQDLGAMPSPAPQASVRPHVPPNVHAAATQVGAKTKEFLHGAGKASRGFLSSIRSKSKKVPN